MGKWQTDVGLGSSLLLIGNARFGQSVNGENVRVRGRRETDRQTIWPRLTTIIVTHLTIRPTTYECLITNGAYCLTLESNVNGQVSGANE